MVYKVFLSCLQDNADSESRNEASMSDGDIACFLEKHTTKLIKISVCVIDINKC